MNLFKVKNNIIQIFFDTLIFFSSFVVSFYLRGQVELRGLAGLPPEYSAYLIEYTIIIIVVKLLVFWLFGMYKKIWKYASLRELLTIVESLALSSAIMIFVFYVFETPYFPKSILVIDFLLSLMLIGGSRFSARIFNEIMFGSIYTRKKRTLIVGAGDAGEMIVREMIRQKNSEYTPIGFLDDDKLKLKQQIHGVKVLDTILNMENVIKKYSVAEVIIAMPSASSKARKEVAFRAKEAGANCKTLPSLYEVIDGKVYLYQIRDIEIEDILGREPVKIKIPDVASEIKDKVVLISGAGGSIGSEICRQILRFGPGEIILVDHSENNLFLVEEELTNKLAFTAAVPIVADIRDGEAMKGVFKSYRPSIVFHAAAYKHVPLMQLNPEAAIRNNYLGTKMLAKFSVDFGVSRFVMLSTDKAVQPENVMGVSKLLSEKYLQALSKVKNTRFMIVRFGNVLGSRGSVVPVFKEQIRSGGPLRVTHPDMKRYFMTIPESAQLVIQACIMGKGGEIYVLDMGEPINILDLATNMIKIYGMEPGKDIEIIYTGPRYGEKMDEELVGKDEELISTELEQIFEAKNKNNVDKEKILDILFNIEKEVQLWDYNNLFKDLKKIVPNFDEKKMWFR